MASTLSIYFDLCRNRPSSPRALQSLRSLTHDDVRQLSETVDDPLAVAVLMRAAQRDPVARQRLDTIAEAVLEELGLATVLDPDDILNTRPPSVVAAEHLASVVTTLF